MRSFRSNIRQCIYPSCRLSLIRATELSIRGTNSTPKLWEAGWAQLKWEVRLWILLTAFGGAFGEFPSLAGLEGCLGIEIKVIFLAWWARKLSCRERWLKRTTHPACWGNRLTCKSCWAHRLACETTWAPCASWGKVMGEEGWLGWGWTKRAKNQLLLRMWGDSPRRKAFCPGPFWPLDCWEKDPFSSARKQALSLKD